LPLYFCRYALTIPRNLPLAGVAPLLCAGITTWTPYMDYGLNKKGYKIGVNGLGGLGHMAVKWGVAFGCEVVVLSRWVEGGTEAALVGSDSTYEQH
jgi:D-arabinose 1-dehydrogenase-like Zn-dependent alcohol dehydrogenase